MRKNQEVNIDSVNEGKHRMVEIGFNLNLLKAKYDVDSECIFTLVRMDNENVNVRESVYVNECENVSDIFQGLPLAALTCGPLRAAAQVSDGTLWEVLTAL